MNLVPFFALLYLLLNLCKLTDKFRDFAEIDFFCSLNVAGSHFIYITYEIEAGIFRLAVVN